MKTQMFVIRGRKGRAHMYLGSPDAKGNPVWVTTRKDAQRGNIEWARWQAGETGGVIDAAGWRDALVVRPSVREEIRAAREAASADAAFRRSQRY